VKRRGPQAPALHSFTNPPEKEFDASNTGIPQDGIGGGPDIVGTGEKESRGQIRKRFLV
jgi:hypothetical protein